MKECTDEKAYEKRDMAQCTNKDGFKKKHGRNYATDT